MEPMKTCTGCGHSLPATREYFPWRNRAAGKLRERCLDCMKSYQQEYKSRRRQELAAASRTYYREHRDDVRAYQRRYYAEHSAEAVLRAAEWVKNNPDRVREITRGFRERHRDQRAEESREWARANPEKARARVRNRRARLAALEGSHSGEDILRLYAGQEGRCFYCEGDLADFYHVDHFIPVVRGGRTQWRTSCWPAPAATRARVRKCRGSTCPRSSRRQVTSTANRPQTADWTRCLT